MFQGIRSAFVDLQRRRRSVEQQETANIFSGGRYNARNNKDACKSGRKDDAHGQKYDWGQIEALQNQNMEVLKPSLNRYNNQIHGSTKTTPNNAHNLDNVIQVRTNLILKEKHNRKYPNISEGDYVKIFDKGKGNYVSRKETRGQWSERKYKVILVGRDMMNNRYYKLDGMSKRYNGHELLLVD